MRLGSFSVRGVGQAVTTIPLLAVAITLALGACDAGKPPPGAGPAGKPTPAAERWLEEFRAYPGARFVCSQHVTGAGKNALHINWSMYATKDDPAEVAAFYPNAGGVAPARAGETLSLSSQDGLKHVSVHPVSASYPTCQVKPPGDARTVFIVSQGTRVPASEAPPSLAPERAAPPGPK